VQEAVGLPYYQEDFIAETGLDFSFMFVIFAGFLGYEATEEDCAEYAEHIGNPDFPVFADGEKRLHDATPMNGESHPEVCAIGPDMTILECWSGHGSVETALDKIRETAGLL